jgi:hypothetical protein
MKEGLESTYKEDILAAFPRRVVAKALCHEAQAEAALLAALDQLAEWAGQQYEGKPIAAAVGFRPDNANGSATLGELCKEPFSKVLSNGFDTLLKCNVSGRVLGYEPLDPPPVALHYAPYRLGYVAHWARDGSIALVVNRAGEVLVFQDEELRFARRGGHWHFLTHAPVITQMGGPNDKDLRTAVYETCLDASFARTGACLGIVTTSSHKKRWTELVATADRLGGAGSTKAKFLSDVIGARRFQDLDRRLRQELAAIDGATLVDNMGKVLAVGAIVQIPGGSTGGGRLAAAKALGTVGVGIKVSQDGQISGFRNSDDPKFTVM